MSVDALLALEAAQKALVEVLRRLKLLWLPGLCEMNIVVLSAFPLCRRCRMNTIVTTWSHRLVL